MKPDVPTISVIIPTRDRDDLLSACLDRLVPGAQTLPAEQYEVIVSDDGDSEATERMLRKRYPWVLYTRGPRRGPAANRNNGVREARGQWIAFTDDDCVSRADWLQNLLSGVSPGIDVVEGKTICPTGLRTPLEEAPVNLTGGLLWSCNLMIRSSTFRELGGFDEDFPIACCEDLELFGRIQRRGIAYRFASEAVIEHPVRRRKAGWAAGERWESRVLLWFKEGHRQSSWSWLPVHLVKVRLSQIRDFPLGFDSLIAFFCIPFELMRVLVGLSSWERKHRPKSTG